MSGAWWLEASCKGKPTSWWYPDRGDQFAGLVARNICRSCPVRRECLDAALDEELVVDSPPSGIRGGLSAQQRAVMVRSRRSPVCWSASQ